MAILSKKLLSPHKSGLIFVPFGMAFILAVSACSPKQQDGLMHEKNSMDNKSQIMSEPLKNKTKMMNVEQEARAVEAVLNGYSAQINSKNVAAMENYVLAGGTEFTIFEGKGKNIGWADYRDNHLAPEFDNKDLVFEKYQYKNFKTSVSADLATVTFAIDMAYTYKGERKEVTRNGTAILKKVGGEWKIAHLHTS